MKNFREKMLSRPLRGCPETSGVVDLLKRPARNHSADHMGLVDSYVFDHEAQKQLDALFSEPESRAIAFDNGRAPLPVCLLDFISWGALIRPFRHASWCQILIDDGSRCYVAAEAEFAAQAPEHADVRLLPVVASASERGFDVPDIERQIQLRFAAVYFACTAIAGHRLSITDRILPKRGETPAARSFARKRALKGRGQFFSYNKVSLITPDSPLFRGGVISWPSAASRRRGHWVTGHWRLIDGGIQPFWTWVDGHESGDADLGWVTKEREVMLQGPVVVRRGFRMPNHEGLAGERVPAEQVPMENFESR